MVNASPRIFYEFYPLNIGILTYEFNYNLPFQR